MQQNSANFNLSWNSHENYWLCFVLPEEDTQHKLEKSFKDKGVITAYLDPTCFAVYSFNDWAINWATLRDALTKNNYNNCKIAIITAQKNRPSMNDVLMNLESIEKIDMIAENLWLGDAILNSRIECHFQPIIDRSSEPFGYEAFARVRLENGELIGGAKIIKAARDMNIEHVLDKYLHILAIRTFAEARLPGNLFINFMAGFIQLPAKYLEGLTDAVQHYNLLAKRIVLDVSDAESVHDLNQISAIIDFCNSKGYTVALDDINSLNSLKNILSKLKSLPDFIKLDRKLTQLATDPKLAREILNLTELAHQKGSVILAEGIETNEVYEALKKSGIDLFQGYYISAPKPVSEIKDMKKAV